MNTNLAKAVNNAFHKASERKWTEIYWAIDVHDTILKSTYSNEPLSEEQFYPSAKEFLQYLSSRKDCILILYSSMHSDQIVEYLEFFKKHSIFFSFANDNRDVKNTVYANFDRKFYFNILLDDKAGFDAEEDWSLLQTLLPMKSIL